MTDFHNEIILYQPDTSIEVEVRLENETVWLTQAQIAKLFDVKVPAVSKHLKNIYNSGELEQDSTFSILENMGYHIGASLKDLGKKLFAFSKMEIKGTDILKN